MFLLFHINIRKVSVSVMELIHTVNRCYCNLPSGYSLIELGVSDEEETKEHTMRFRTC